MWYNPIIRLILLSPLHGLVDNGILLLRYTGRKSGKKYDIPISYVRDGEDFLVVTFKKRKWWRNFMESTPVRLRWRGRESPALAKAIYGEDAEVAKDLAIYLEHQAGLLKYFEVEKKDDGSLNMEQVEKAAGKRVMVRITPTDK